MPHFGLIDEEKLGPVESLRMRSRLHIRGGRKRLEIGKISLGILTLYDAVNLALQWYVLTPAQSGLAGQHPDKDFRDESAIISALLHNGTLDGRFDYGTFNELVERALKEELFGYDYTGLLKGIESVMVQLGVMPFDESTLPPEEPGSI